MNITRIFLSVLLLFLFNNLFSQWTIQGKWSIGGEWVTIATLQESGNKRSAIIKAQGTYLAFKFNQSSSWYGDNLVTSSTYSGTYEYWYGNVGISEGDATISSGITNGDYYLIAWNGDNSDFWTLEHIENVSCVVKKDVGGSPTEETIALTQNTVDTQNWFKNSAMTVSTSNQKWQFKFLPNGQENSNFNQGGGFLIKIVDFWNLSSPGYIANGQDHWIEWNNIPTGTYNIAVQLTGTSNAYEITTSDLSLPVQLTSFTAEAENGSV
ncbi:MAG: hypothetical protein KJ799_01340, partial [Bacteroidetes bacterium]|nr:hypothetical protein [Bacteroidota bacterium]